MIALHPNILKMDGKKAFAVLPYEEFVKIREDLTDYEDLKVLREAKMEEANAPTIPFHNARKTLGI